MGSGRELAMDEQIQANLDRDCESRMPKEFSGQGAQHDQA